MIRLVLAMMVCAGAAQAEDMVIDQTGFTAVHVNEDIAVTIEIGPEYSVTARAVSGDISKLEVNRYAGWLAFSRDARWFIFPNGRQDQFEVTITTPVLNEVKSFDGSFVTVTGALSDPIRAEADDGRLELMDVDLHNATLVVNGGGRLSAWGTCEMLTLSGDHGEIDAGGLECRSAVVATGDSALTKLPTGTPLTDAHPNEAETN